MLAKYMWDKRYFCLMHEKLINNHVPFWLKLFSITKFEKVKH